MTAPQTVTADLVGGRRRRCESKWVCPDNCCAPAQCRNGAAWRVTYACATPSCERATHVLLLCDVCADAAGPDATLRPL